jgi:hypothetical protein
MYTWDALDMRNLFSIAMGELVRYYLVNEDILSPADNATAMCLSIFVFIVGLGAHTACSPVPGILPRMRKQFLDPDLRTQLQVAVIDGWVAFLLLTSMTVTTSSVTTPSPLLFVARLSSHSRISARPWTVASGHRLCSPTYERRGTIYRMSGTGCELL